MSSLNGLESGSGEQTGGCHLVIGKCARNGRLARHYGHLPATSLLCNTKDQDTK